ncbi:MAG: 30S ribosomal protein S16 [Ignavibacteriales bacterium]|nr:30S ribosomal protein S16 [Ignavibacteriales bacterium]
MAVKLRLLRMGKKRQPIYKVVAADVRSPRDGKIIEAVGSYNPKSNPAAVDLNEERVLYWLNCGAQPTITVKTLLNKEGILLKRDLKKQGLNESEINAKFEDWKNLKNSVLADKNAKAEKKKQEKAEAEKKKLAQELKEKESENTEVKDTASGEVS